MHVYALNILLNTQYFAILYLRTNNEGYHAMSTEHHIYNKPRTCPSCTDPLPLPVGMEHCAQCEVDNNNEHHLSLDLTNEDGE